MIFHSVPFSGHDKEKLLDDDHTILSCLVHRSIRFEPLQSEAGKMLLRRSGRDPDDISSVVLVEKDR